MSSVGADQACLNCGAELRGEFCHGCGQKASSTHLRLHEVFHEVTHEFLHLNGKVFQTLKVLVTAPGRLTADFVEGRRARYITPLRLYLTTSVLFFVLTVTVPNPTQPNFRITMKDDNGQVITQLTPELQQRANRIRLTTVESIPRLAFVLMPAFALLTCAFYRRSQPHVAAHLYYALHAHAFWFLVLAVAVLFRPLGTIVRGTVGVLGAGWLVAYYYIALRRVYAESWLNTIAKGTAIGVLYVAVIGLSLLALFNIIFAVVR